MKLKDLIREEVRRYLNENAPQPIANFLARQYWNLLQDKLQTGPKYMNAIAKRKQENNETITFNDIKEVLSVTIETLQKLLDDVEGHTKIERNINNIS